MTLPRAPSLGGGTGALGSLEIQVNGLTAGRLALNLLLPPPNPSKDVGKGGSTPGEPEGPQTV